MGIVAKTKNKKKGMYLYGMYIVTITHLINVHLYIDKSHIIKILYSFKLNAVCICAYSYLFHSRKRKFDESCLKLDHKCMIDPFGYLDNVCDI